MSEEEMFAFCCATAVLASSSFSKWLLVALQCRITASDDASLTQLAATRDKIIEVLELTFLRNTDSEIPATSAPTKSTEMRA